MIRKSQGFALLDLIFVCGILGLLMSIALPRLVLARQAAGAASAIGAMRTISSSELAYALTCGNGFYAPKLTTLGTPPPAATVGYISPTLGVADVVSRSGYRITLEARAFPMAPATCNGLPAGEAGQGFRAWADPIEPVKVRFFATNASGMVYEHTLTLSADIAETGEPLIGHILGK